MLKANSKKVQENLKNYIIKNCEFNDYDLAAQPKAENFTEYAKAIYNDFIACVYSGENSKRYFNYNESKAFEYYMSGLPSHGLGEYYYNVSAVSALGAILEETEEQDRYNETDAENLLTYLIYRSIKKEVAKNEL